MVAVERVMEPLTARTLPRMPLQSQPRRSKAYGGRDLLDVAVRYWRLAAVLFFICAVLSVLTLLFYPRTYTAASAIVFDRNDARPYEAVVELRKQERDRSVMETELDVIKSRVFAGTVVDALGLVTDPDFNNYLPEMPDEQQGIVGRMFTAIVSLLTEGAGNGPELRRKRLVSDAVQRDRAITQLLNSYTVDRKGDSLALTIRVKQDNPVKAATIADAIAEQYVEWTAKLTDEATKNTVTYLRGEATRLGLKISEMERDIASFVNVNDLTFDPQDDLLKARMIQLNQQFSDAKADQAKTLARFNEANGLLASSDKLAVGRILTSPQLDRLRGENARIEQSRAQLIGRFGRNHPMVVDANAELNANLALVETEASRIVDELSSEAKVAAVRTEDLSAEITLLQKRMEGRDLAEIRRRERERDLLAEQKRYDQIAQRLGDLNPERGERKASAQVASFAEVPTSPSFPKASLVLATGLIGAFILTLIGIICAEAIDERLYKPSDVEELLNRPTLITIPNLGRQLRQIGMPLRIVGDQPMSILSKAMRNLCMAWETIDHSAGGRVVMLCSPAVGDGKTTTALGMAVAARAAGLRAVIVDLDPRDNGAAKQLGVQLPEQNLMRFFEAKSDIKSVVITSTSHPFVDVVPCRPMLRGIEKLCSDLREQYDLVIVDAPALELEEDSVWLASHVDSIIVVIAAGRTKSRDLVGALNRLAVNQPVILGSVLNFFGRPPGRSILSHIIARLSPTAAV